MNRIVIVSVLFLWMISTAHADTYKWTDDKGVVSFTDDLNLIPQKYRAKAKQGEDITILNPKVQKELKEQEDRAILEERNRPQIVPTPDSLPPPQQFPVLEPKKPVSDELPPGRTKSQRIRDNIERRETEVNK